MKVVITGANSAVGQAILRCGPQQGREPKTLLALVRSSRAAEQLRSQMPNAEVVQAAYEDEQTLDAAFQSASAVIHLAGILVEKPGSTYEQANVASTRSIVEAAKRSGLRKFVLVSATGADEKSRNRYYRTKGQAEALLRESGLCYTVLRAPLLLGPSTAGAAALQRNVSGRRAKLIGGGRNLQQPLHVHDLARAATAATEVSVARNLTVDVVGPVSISERELVELAARLLGREVRVGSISKGLLSLALTLRSFFGGVGFSRDALDVITSDTRLDSQLAANALGIQLTGIDQMIRDSVAQGS
jgi:uncharacterized protein YbjT (DUF2867 family)